MKPGKTRFSCRSAIELLLISGLVLGISALTLGIGLLRAGVQSETLANRRSRLVGADCDHGQDAHGYGSNRAIRQCRC